MWTPHFTLVPTYYIPVKKSTSACKDETLLAVKPMTIRRIAATDSVVKPFSLPYLNRRCLWYLIFHLAHGASP